MNKPAVIIDLDGVIYDFLNSFWDELVWYHGYSNENYFDFLGDPNKYICTTLGEQLLQVPIIYERIKCDFRVKEALEKLNEIYTIYYVTSRPECVFLATKHWLTREHVYFGNLIFTHDKGKVAEELKPVFAVDDQWKYVEQMKDHTRVFLLNQSYNKSYDWKFRINSLMELVCLS